jgi:dipeptidyl aminopeptidase/acylaminoacyl peptidase
MKFKAFAVVFVFASTALAQNAKHPFTFEDMMKLKRLDGPVPSPNGKWVVFSATDVDLAANTKISHLWIVPASGGESRRLNETPNHEERPRFSPDGKRLIWTSKATDPTQIWMCDFDTDSGVLKGKPHQVTNISTGADGGIWSPDGKNIVFVSAVYPDCNPPSPGYGAASADECNKKRDEELKNNKVKAKIFTRLFYRHWSAFTEFKRSHLFVISADATAGNTGLQPVRPEGLQSAESQTQDRMSDGRTGQSPVFQSRDLTPGDHDVPPFNLGGQDMYAISPDGQELAYTSNIDEVEATSTNNEIFIVPMSGGTPKKISTSPGSDSTPLYSPDGKYIAWRSQARAGFEADKWRLFVQDRESGQTRDLTTASDLSVGSFVWDPGVSPEARDGALEFTAEFRGGAPIYRVHLDGNVGRLPGSPEVKPEADLHADELVWSKGVLFFTRMSASAPNEIWSIEGYSHTGPVTHVNDELLARIDMQPLEAFWFRGAESKSQSLEPDLSSEAAMHQNVQGFMIKPPGFDPAKKYPLKFLIHGGPQGAWGNEWSYRWNAQLFATNGYVVVMINFHGSTGYGQKFTDSISGDWGGKPYVDLMKGLDYVEKTYPFIDKNREAALGASYGGYMANWILGHTNRFKCLVSHDGIFNTESAYGTTEEIWFPEWEFKGPPWKQREPYRKFSPHLFADKFKTPTLVVHGQLDYRLDVSEGFQLFTTLQRLKIPSKMLYFPDEGHWVLKPQNSQLWYKTVNDWVDQWCAK